MAAGDVINEEVKKEDCGCGCKGKGHKMEKSPWAIIAIALAVVAVVGYAFGWWSMIAKAVKKQVN